MTSLPDEFRTGVNERLSVEQRLELARKAKDIRPDQALSNDERNVLKGILVVLMEDAEIRVRQALAETLATSPNAPHDIVYELAKDDDLVASPVLRLSSVLSPTDLVSLIRSQLSSRKMIDIAERNEVPASVCLALIEHGDDKTASHLLRNPGAQIPDAGVNRIVDRFGSTVEIQTGLINRDTLPATVIEKAVQLISAELLTRMIERHSIPPIVGRRLVMEVHDRVMLGFTTKLSSDGMFNLIDQLISEERLTPSLIFRSLIVGNLEFVVHVIALQCQLGPQYVRDRLIDGDPTALEKLWNAANLPKPYFELAVGAIEVLTKANRSNPRGSPDYCRFQIVEKFLNWCSDQKYQLDANDERFLEAARNESLLKLAEMD